MRKALSNVSALFVAETVNRATSFVVYALVARFLGAASFGQIALATSLFHVFNRFTVLGLKTLLVREIARQPGLTAAHVASASFAVTVASAAGFGVLEVVMAGLGYATDTRTVLRVLFVGIIPYSLSQVSEAVFIGWQRTGFVLASTAPLYVVQTAVVYFMLENGADVLAVAWSIVVVYSTIAVSQYLLVVRRLDRPLRRPGLEFSWNLVRRGLPFVGIQGTNAVRSSATIIVLSALVDEARLGIFSAAAQILVPISLIATATAAAIFPMMSVEHERDRARFLEVGRSSMEALMALVIPAAVGVYVVADQLMELIYGGAEFGQSANLARILLIVGLCNGFTSVMGQVLWAGDREVSALQIAVTNTIFSLVFTWLLASAFGVYGAAWAAGAVAIVNVIQHYVPILRSDGNLQVFGRTVRAGLAAAGMGALLLALEGIGLAGAIAVGVLSYVVLLAAVYVVTDGRRFRPWALGRLRHVR